MKKKKKHEVDNTFLNEGCIRHSEATLLKGGYPALIRHVIYEALRANKLMLGDDGPNPGSLS